MRAPSMRRSSTRRGWIMALRRRGSNRYSARATYLVRPCVVIRVAHAPSSTSSSRSLGQKTTSTCDRERALAFVVGHVRPRHNSVARFDHLTRRSVARSLICRLASDLRFLVCFVVFFFVVCV